MASRVFGRAVSERIKGAFIVCWLAFACIATATPSIAAGPDSATARGAASEPHVRVRWLTELGAESSVVPGRAHDPEARAVVVAPGTAWGFRFGPQGEALGHRAVAVDPSAAYGVAKAGEAVIVGGREGLLSVWRRLGGERTDDLAWRQDLGERITAVAWDENTRVLAATWNQRLQAFAATDGGRLWVTDIGGRADAPPLVSEGTVFVATKAKMLLRLDASTGAVRWRVPLPGAVVHPLTLAPQPTPLLAGITSDGQLLAVNPESGKALWSERLPARAASGPLVFSSNVFAVTADGSLHCYAADGVLRWVAPDAADGPADLLVPSGGIARVLVVSKKLVMIDQESGTRLAEYPTDAVKELQRRFAMAMIDGEKTYSEAEKRAAVEQEAFEITGSLFGPVWPTERQIALATTESWIYLFDRNDLRPVWRYHSGQSASGAVASTEKQVLAAGGDDVFALDSAAGRLRWRRNVGTSPVALAAAGTVGVLGNDRFTVLDENDGTPLWTRRGSFLSASPVRLDAAEKAPAWLLTTKAGEVWMVGADSQALGAPLPLGQGLLTLAATGEGSWTAAMSDGRLVGMSWEPGSRRLLASWEMTLGEPLSRMQLDAGEMLIRLVSGPLVSVDPITRQERWRLTIAPDERLHFPSQSGIFAVSSPSALRAHDARTGERLCACGLTSPALAVTRCGDRLVWLDRWGKGGSLELGNGRVAGPFDLTPALQDGLALPTGVVVTTVTGEVGFVEVVEGTELFDR